MPPAANGEEEPGAEPELEENIPVLTSTARTTGTTFLTNIREIGLFDGAGRVTCLVIDRADSNHLIAGAATGGLWTTHNRGKTWAPIDDHLPTLSIRSLCQDPFQANVYYASTFTLMQVGTTNRPDIYKSTDGGQTFQLLPASAGTFNQVVKVACSPVTAGTVYALSDAFVAARGLYRSQNNGQTFTQVLPINSINVTDVELLPDGAVLVSAGPEVYRSPNGNAGTYTPVSGLNGNNTFANIDFAYCQSQPNNVYGISTGGNSGVGVFKSTDGGQNWSFLQSLASAQFTRTIGVKPDNPNFFFAGSVAMYLSQNAGNAFQVYMVGGVDYWSVNFDPHNVNKVFVTLDQGVVEVSLNPFNPNGNTAYKRRDSLFNCAQIYAGDYFPIGDKVIVGMQDLGTYQTGPGLERSVASGDGGYCFFHKQDTTIAYGCYQRGEILKKTNIHIPFPQPGFTQPVTILNQLDANGDGTVDEGAFFINPFWVNNADGEQLYYPTKRRLWRSLNGGASWQPISAYYDLTGQNNVSEPYIEGNHKSNPIVYWPVRDTLYIMRNAKTATAGSELKIEMPGRVRSVRVDPLNDSVVYITTYATTTGPRIYRSGNLFKGNVQWTNLTGDMPDKVAVNCMEVNPLNKNQMVAGTNEGLYVSTDGGQHWDKELQFPSVSIPKTSLRFSDKRLFVYTYGRGAWAASFPPVNTAVVNPEKEKELVVWPNPAKDVVHVAVPGIYRNTVLRVWSMDGKLQKVVEDLQHTPQSINMSDLPAGSYIVALYEGDRRVGTARVIKQ